MQLQIQCIPAKLRPHVLEETGGFHAEKAAGCHEEGGESHQVLARGAGHTVGPFQGRKSTDTICCTGREEGGTVWRVYFIPACVKCRPCSSSLLSNCCTSFYFLSFCTHP